MEKKKDTSARPPIVVVLGHVDHGKTTLLDKIRNTHVQIKEAGGITQSIGASQITTKEGKKITFIDTPGHAAFSNMRQEGAEVADIAILVVAADDGVKPQTTEALDDIKKANIPFIVAFTKTDLPSANIEKPVTQLTNLGVNFEKKGGDTPYVSVSGKTGEGLDELLETIILISEINGLIGDKTMPLEAVVIETTKGKGGPLASVVVRNGSLRKGDDISSGNTEGKIKSLTDSQGKQVMEAVPGDAVQILGFSDLPQTGAIVQIKGGVGKKDLMIEKRIRKDVQEGQVPIIIKADTAGSMEAILRSLPEKVFVAGSGVGEIGESNVLEAKSSNADIFAFNLKTRPSIEKLADMEGVKIETFNIIYKLLERIDEIIKGEKEEILGSAQIIATFPFNNKKVAGCKMLQGVISRTDKPILKRDTASLGQVRIVSIKKQKSEITQASGGEEFGIIFEPQLDFEVGDVLLSVKK